MNVFAFVCELVCICVWTGLYLCVHWSVFVCALVCICVWTGLYLCVDRWDSPDVAGHKCIFFNKELSVANQMPPSFSTNSERSCSGSPHTATIPFSSCRCSESKPKFLSPNSSSAMGEITPTTSLYLLWKYQRIGDPTQSWFIISENIPVSLATVQWMSKGSKHVGRK